MRTLIIPVGCPGSGKTYFCDKVYHEYGIKSVSSDQVREDLYGDASIQGDFQRVFNVVYDRINSLYKKGEKVVILDATNVTRRTRWKAIFNISPNEIIYVIMPNNLNQALINNKNRQRVVPEKVIYHMYSSYKRDMPCVEKDFFNGVDCSIYHLDNEFETTQLKLRLEGYRG